ncbi:MAG: hypothetical protein WA749_11500 [Gelidibacter sp.]
MKQSLHIPKTLIRKLLSYCVIVFLPCSYVYSQEVREVDFHFETDSIAVERGFTFTNFLVIKNQSANTITIDKLAPELNYPGLLLSPKSNFILIPDETKRFPIKFIASLDFMMLQANAITFNLTYSSITHVKNISTSFSLKKPEEKNIAIIPFSRENYINPDTPEAIITMYVENRGYSKRSIRLDFQSSPEDLEMTPRQQTISLEGQEKRLVEITISLRRQNTLFPDYNIQVKATELTNNENVGSSYIKLVVLSHNRQLSRGSHVVSGTNFAEVNYNENSSGFNYMQLRSNTEFSASENIQGRFNLAADYYLQNGLYNFYDTWLEVESEKSLARIGNIYGNDYDYSISGRGAKISTEIGVGREFEILGLEDSYQLYGSYFPQNESAKMAGAKYSFGALTNFNGKMSYVYDHDPRQSIETHVTNFVSAFVLNDQHQFRTEVGLSHELGWIQKDKNLGVSVGLNYDTSIGHWDFQSLNTYATSGYAGMSRGSFNLNQRIGHKISNTQRLFFLYRNSQVQPEYLNFQHGETLYNTPEYFNNTQSAQVGYQFNVKNWNFLLSPQIGQQKATSNFRSHDLLTYRLYTNIGTAFGQHGFNLTTEYTHSKEDLSSDWFQGFRSTMSYRFKDFSINGSAQYNPISVFDLNYNFNGDLNFVNYNVYTSYNFLVLNNTLSGSILAGINYSGLYENKSNNFTGNIEYKIANSWSTTGYANYSHYSSTNTNGYSGNNYQIRVGIKKYFARATAIGNHKVSFQLFEDKNYNGIRDVHEAVLANEIVKLDDHTAITDKNGKVTFQNVPKGSYKLKVNESAGSRLMVDPLIEVNRNINTQVGLVKNIRITGELVEVKQAYDVLNTEVTGIVVYAKSEEGDIQTTVVNQNNKFEFFLKDGTYSIYIENDSFSFINPTQTIAVEDTDDLENLVFKYKKKDTTIKVKKF